MWEFRESKARALDLPGYKILPSEILLRFAESLPHEGDPGQIPRLPSRLSPEIQEGFLHAFEMAVKSDTKQWPKPLPPSRKPVKSPHPDLLADLRKIRDRVASSLSLDPSLLAPRATLLAVALTGLPSAQTVRESAQWMRWQEDLLMEPWLEAAQRYQRPC
jgi:ribonuclease D